MGRCVFNCEFRSAFGILGEGIQAAVKGDLERVLQKEDWVLERETGAIGVVEFKEQLFESRNSEKLTLFFRFE